MTNNDKEKMDVLEKECYKEVVDCIASVIKFIAYCGGISVAMGITSIIVNIITVIRAEDLAPIVYFVLLFVVGFICISCVRAVVSDMKEAIYKWTNLH